MAHRRPHTDPACMYRAILFDMDGTLLDSERIAWDGFVATCASFDLPADFDRYRLCIGVSGERSRALLSTAFGPGFPAAAFFEQWERHYLEHALEQPVPPKPGVERMLEGLAEAGIPLGVATSSRHAHARRKLANAGLLTHFQLVIGGDEVRSAKPAPEIYLRAAARLGLPSRTCLAVEDSSNGLLSAHRAGCRTACIPDLVPLPEDVAALADLVLDDCMALAAHLRQAL